MTTKPRPSRKHTLTVRAFAKKVGVSPATVRNWCRRYDLGKAIPIPGGGYYYMLSEAEVARMRNPANRPRIGRPIGN